MPLSDFTFLQLLKAKIFERSFHSCVIPHARICIIRRELKNCYKKLRFACNCRQNCYKKFRCACNCRQNCYEKLRFACNCRQNCFKKLRFACNCRQSCYKKLRFACNCRQNCYKNTQAGGHTEICFHSLVVLA